MVYIYFTKIFALFYNNEYVGREFGFENELFKWLLHLQQEYILRAWYSFHVNMQWQMYTHIHIYSTCIKMCDFDQTRHEFLICS